MNIIIDYTCVSTKPFNRKNTYSLPIIQTDVENQPFSSFSTWKAPFKKDKQSLWLCWNMLLNTKSS